MLEQTRGENVLDIVLSSQNDLVDNVKIHEPLGSSDHNQIQCRLDMRKYSFSQRVINEWNKLPNDCVNASSVNMFKNRIDRYLIRAGYTYMRTFLDSR